MVFKLSTILR